MAFARPKAPPGGSRLPVVRRSSSIIRETPSETTITTTTSIPKTRTSSDRQSDCGAGAPCGSRGVPAVTPASRSTGRARPCPGSSAKSVASVRTSATPARTPATAQARTLGVCPGSIGTAGAVPRSIPAGVTRIPGAASARTPAVAQARTLGVCPGSSVARGPAARSTPGIPRPSGYATSTSGTGVSIASRIPPPGPSTGAIPKASRHQIVAQGSKTSKTCGKQTTVTQEVSKRPGLPEGRYALGLRYPPHPKGPDFLRKKKEERPARAMGTTVAAPSSLPPEPYEYSFLDSDIESEYGAYYTPRPGAVSQPTALERDVEEILIEEAALMPGRIVKVSGSRKSPGQLPVIQTGEGPVQATEQVITEKRVEKTPGSEKISRHITATEQQGCGAIQMELDTQTIEPGGLPKRSGDAAMEAVSVTSIVSVAPGGIKESQVTVIYETSKTPERINISPEVVERLVTEESMDVDNTRRFKPIDLKVISPKSYPIRKREHELKLNYASVLELEQSVVLPEPNPDQEQEEVQAETVAYIMHTEEQGHRLGTQPAQMYEVLFPDIGGDTTITVNSAAPAPLQDVIVPVNLPQTFHTSQGITQELETAATTTPYQAESKPEGDAYTSQKREKRKAKNVAKRGPRLKLTDIPLLSREPPPWAMEDLQPIIDIVGAPPTNKSLPHRREATHLVAESIDEKDQEEVEQTDTRPEEDTGIMAGLEYSLMLEPPTHTSRVQLRGSTRPAWFPGYYVALPDIPELVRVDRTPVHVLSSVWQAVQPRYFPDESIITV